MTKIVFMLGFRGRNSFLRVLNDPSDDRNIALLSELLYEFLSEPKMSALFR